MCDIILKKNQPRIIQLGFNKCGSRSLHNLLKDNGISSCHYMHGTLARTICEHVKKEVPLLGGTLESYQAFFDMEYIWDPQPIYIAPTLFKLLDLQYPDSYFILNTRPCDHWIRSRLSHKGYAKRLCDVYGMDIPQLVHLWKRQWHSHLREVKDHFAQRPDQLLIFDIEHDPPEKVAMFLQSICKIDTRHWKHHGKTRHG